MCNKFRAQDWSEYTGREANGYLVQAGKEIKLFYYYLSFQDECLKCQFLFPIFVSPEKTQNITFGLKRDKP